MRASTPKRASKTLWGRYPKGNESAYTIEEMAAVLRMGRNTAYNVIKRGQVPSIRLGRRILIPRRAVDQLLEQAK
jgi:excisionase family DNA binding protein